MNIPAKETNLLAKLDSAVQTDSKAAVDMALELLTHPSSEVVARAATALGHLEARRSVAPLRTLLSPHQPSTVSTAAMRSLGRLGGEDVWRTFEAILEDSGDPLHRPLLDELGHLEGHPRLVQALKKNLYTHRYPFKVRTLEVLSTYRGPTVEALFQEYLDESGESLSAAAARGLVHFPSPVNYRRLADRAQHGPWTVQVACLESLLKIENRPPASDLTPLLSCEHPEVVLRTLEALEQTGEAEAIPAVEAILNHPAWKIRERVARFLGVTCDPRVVNDLEILCSDRRAAVRAAAFRAAAEIPGIDHQEWGRHALGDQTALVRAEAPVHLGEAGTKDARNMLFGQLKDLSAEVRLKALDALTNFELLGFEAMLSPLASDKEPEVKRRAREILVSLGAPSEELHLERAKEMVDAGELTEARDLLRRLTIERPEDVRVLYELARLSRRLDNPGEAESYLRQVLIERPEHVGARKQLAEALLEQGRRSEACDQLREACAGDHTNWKLWVTYGELSLEQGQARTAAGAFETALDLHSTHVPAHQGLARAYAEMGNFEASLREWSYLHERDPADPEPLFEMGRWELERGHAEEAASYLARARELGRSDRELLVRLADAMEALGAHQEALDTREQCLAYGPADLPHRLKMARGYLICGDPARSRAVIRNLLGEVDPTPEILEIRARCEEEMEELEAALDTRIRLLGLDEDFPGAQRDYALLLRKLGRHDQARAAFRKHLTTDPLDLEARRWLIDLELLGGRTEAALTLLEAALEQFPANAGLHAQAARIHMSRGQWKQGADQARQATRLEPEDGTHRILLGDLFLKTGSHEAARLQFEHALELGCDDPTLRLRIGQLLLEENAPAKALIHLEKAAASELEDSQELALGMGQALQQLQRIDRARAWLARARRPGDWRAHRYLAELELEHGDPRDALDHIRALASVAPDDEALPWLEGRCRRLLGEPGAAMVQLEKALQRSPGDPDLVCELAACYFALGQFRPVTELYPGSPLLPTEDPELRIAKGEAQLRLGNHAKAAAWARRMVELDPDLISARALLTRSLLALGDLPAAEEAVKEGLEIDGDAVQLLEERARLYLKKGYLEAAQADLDRASGLPTASPEIHLLKARVKVQQRRHEDALEHLHHYLLKSPRAVEGLRLQGECLRTLGRQEEAVETFENLLARAKDDAPAQLELADLLVELNRHEEAAAHLTRYLEVDEDRGPALRRLARLAESDGELESAAKYLQQLCEVEDGEFARFKLLQILLRRKDLGAAWPILERSMELYPNLGRRLGEEMRDLGDIGLAKDLFGFVLSRDPHDMVAMQELAICQYRLGAYKPARRAFERVLSRRPLHGGAHFYLGLLEMLEGRSEAAIPHLEAAVEQDPQNLTAHRHLSKIHLAAKRYPQALEGARAGLETDRCDRELLLVAAGSCLAMDHEEQAFDAFRLAARQGVDERSHIPAVRLALKRGDAPVARFLAEEYFRSRPEDPVGSRLLSRAAAADGDPVRATEVLSGLWEEGEATLYDLRTLGRAASACDQLELSSRAIQASLEMESEHGPTWLLLGHVELQRGKHRDALAAYRKAADLQPDEADAWRGMGEALLPQARYREALEPAEAAARLRPGDGRNLRLLGRVQNGLGNLQRAREALEAALVLPGLDSTKDQIRLDLASLLRQLGEAGSAKRVLESLPLAHGRDVARQVTEISFEAEDFAAAAHHAKAYLAEYPEEAGILEILGRSLVNLGMDKQARSCLERHLALFGTPVGLVQELSSSRIRRGQTGEAIQLLVQALEREPTSASLWRSLAEARKSRQDLPGCLKALERALESDPNSLDTIRKLGKLYRSQAYWERSEQLYTEACRRHPYELDLLLALGETLYAQARYPESAARFQRATELDARSATAHRELGLCLARLGQRARSVESLRRAVQADTSDFQALYALARAYRDLGQVEMAAVHFERLLSVARPGTKEHRAARQYLGARRAA
jgi:tetratricopeptide (TPR) repeat protein